MHAIAFVVEEEEFGGLCVKLWGDVLAKIVFANSFSLYGAINSKILLVTGNVSLFSDQVEHDFLRSSQTPQTLFESPKINFQVVKYNQIYS